PWCRKPWAIRTNSSRKLVACATLNSRRKLAACATSKLKSQALQRALPPNSSRKLVACATSFRGVVPSPRAHLHAGTFHFNSYWPEGSGPSLGLAVISQHELRAHFGCQAFVDFVEIARFLLLIFVDRRKERPSPGVFTHRFHNELTGKILNVGRGRDAC